MSISLDSLSSLNQIGTDIGSTSGLEDSLNGDLSNASDDQLMDVCRDFESYFTEQVFKAMEKMVPTNEEDSSGSSGQMMDYYKDSLIEQYAKQSSEGDGLGIAQMLYEQMKRNYSV